ncbi:MAG TPA: response regulator [Candidatus Limnocylindria bacterium]|nr:response regulator [Candidatus Limnocylindria bacterium]
MAEPSADSKHVLVVNDTEEIIELLRDIIEGIGLRISATTFAPEDLAAIQKVAPDLVIMDLLVGGETAGWQLLQKMKMSRDTDAIPVIVCTAALDAVRQQEGWLTSKGVKIVLKPFNVDDMELAIKKALALPDIVGS